MYNKTTYFLFPLLYDSLFLKPAHITNLDKNGFNLINLFISDKKKEYLYPQGKYLFLLLNIQNIMSERFIEFMRNIKRHKNYDSYYNPDYKQVMIIFKLDTYQKEVVSLFIQGKYSKFDEKYKLSFVADAAKKIDSVYNIITKNPYLKAHIEHELDTKLDDDAELESLINYEREVFNYSDYKNKFVNDIISNVYSK